MSELKGYCPNCKSAVKESALFCPNCGHTFEQASIGAQTENQDKSPGLMDHLLAAVRVLGIILLVLAGMFLVFLAFLYAACSHMNI
ncbi:MAG TPA: zinc ribbon domain-containing protein [Candidatus Sulfotelmatobacter sp.]|nr:zinc ribbon domain-containing protein [Candidatus Sulfotelmatobacter sp.]